MPSAPLDAHSTTTCSRLAQLGVFNGAVLVARHDTVLLHGGYGLADLAHCIPVRRSTVFDIGSVAKQFAATAVLRLELDGKLSVGDSLPRFFRDVPPKKRSITVHQLLTHTSGLPGDLEATGARTTPADDPALDRKLLALPLDAPPGTAFRYSNAGYALVRLIVERTAGMSFRQFITERLLRPAGLGRTGWHSDSALWTARDVAHGLWGRYDSGSPRDWANYGATFGAGEMVSSVGELYDWMQALASDRVVSADARRRLFTSQAQWTGLGADTRGANAFYGYGWEIRNGAAGTPALIFHNGIFDNFRTTLRHYLSDDSYVIVLTNSVPNGAGDRADELANTLRDVMRGDDVTSPPASECLSPSSETMRELRDARRCALPGLAEHRRPLWLAPLDQPAFDALWQPDSTRRAKLVGSAT